MFNPSVTDSFDEMSFHYNYPIHRACRDGDVQTVSMALASDQSLTTAEDCFKHLTPIHWAATFGKLDCIRQIVSVNPSTINVQSCTSFRTPLHCASEAGHPHCLLWLIQAGANPEVKGLVYLFGANRLSQAFNKDQPFVNDIQGETALHKAARNGNAECVSYLIATNCNVSTQNSNGQTPCMIAEQAGFPAIANFIRQQELLVNDFHPMGNGFSHFQAPRLSRKRTRDMCDNVIKRVRSDDAPMVLPPVIRHCMVYPVTTSVLEHDRLCKLENGYTNFILESMMSDFHGC